VRRAERVLGVSRVVGGRRLGREVGGGRGECG